MTNKLDQLANTALEAQIALEEAKEAFEQAKADLITEAKKQGKYDTSLKAAGHARIKIQPNRYFDAEVASKLVTKKVLAECTVKKLDTNLLKQHLNPIQVEQAMKNHAEPFKFGISVLKD